MVTEARNIVSVEPFYEDEGDSLVSLRLFTRNERIVQACKNKGITQGQLAKQLRWSYPKLSRIVNLWGIVGEADKIKIAIALEQPIDYLFPETLDVAIGKGVFRKRKVELKEPEIISLIEVRQQPVYDDTEMLETIDKKLLTEALPAILRQALTSREYGVVALRFGLEDGRSHTLKEVGQEFNVNGERIRQIEDKALRKLRHPDNSQILKKYL